MLARSSRHPDMACSGRCNVLIDRTARSRTLRVDAQSLFSPMGQLG
jgi:hypothetical protein